MYLLRKPTTRRIISQVADDTETLRSSHTSRAGTDVDSVSRSSSRPTARDQNFALDGGVTNSLVYRWAEQQRVAPRSSLQTNFQSDIAHDVHVPRPLTDECFNSSDTEVFNLRAPYLEKPPQRSRHLSMPNSPSTLEQRAHNKSGKFNQGYLSPSPIISRQWNSDSQITPQSNRSPSSPYGKLSTLFTRSLVHLKALAQGSSSNFPTSPTMSREEINRESDLTPSIDLTTMGMPSWCH
jgi:hypothetical protein